MKSWRMCEVSKENKVVATFEDPTAHNRMDEELQKQRHELNKRVKQLNCLYTISNLAREQDISLEKIAKGIIARIPPACQYPESTCARLTLEGQ